MKKILFIVYYLNTGGVNSSLSCLYDYLKKKCDIRVFALCHKGSNAFSFSDVVMPECYLLADYYRGIPSNNLWAIIRCLVLKIVKKIGAILGWDIRKWLMTIARKQILNSFKPDIVVAYQENDAALLASYFDNTKKISWIHFDYSKHISETEDEKLLYSQFEQIICVSKYTASTFRQRYPQLRLKTNYIYNLLDKNRILCLSKEVVEDNRFSTNLFTIVSVGRICPEKGFSTIPEVAESLKQQGCKFYWYIIGPGNDKTEMNKLSFEINRKDVSDCVILLGEKTNPYPYFKKSNLYVATSYTEACPMVFNEARVLGIPIISTNFGSSYEFINEGVDGFITPRDELSSVIRKVIHDKNIYQTLKLGAENFQLDEKHIHQQIDQLLSLN